MILNFSSSLVRQYVIASIATIIILTSLPLPLLPDSLVYLHFKERFDDAMKVLSQIRDSDKFRKELEDYKLGQTNKFDLFALFKNKTFLKSLSLGILISAGTNSIGYNAVSFYLQNNLESTQTNVQPEIASVIIGCVQLFAAICTTFLTKMFGRRPLLIYSMIELTNDFRNKDS